MHKPIIRDLISLYDDLVTIRRQMQEAAAEAAQLTPGMADHLVVRLKTMETNIEHNCEFILEVLARLEGRVAAARERASSTSTPSVPSRWNWPRTRTKTA